MSEIPNRIRSIIIKIEIGSEKDIKDILSIPTKYTIIATEDSYIFAYLEFEKAVYLTWITKIIPKNAFLTKRKSSAKNIIKTIKNSGIDFIEMGMANTQGKRNDINKYNNNKEKIF